MLKLTLAIKKVALGTYKLMCSKSELPVFVEITDEDVVITTLSQIETVLFLSTTLETLLSNQIISFGSPME